MSLQVEDTIKVAEGRREGMVENVARLERESANLWNGTRKRIARDATDEEAYPEKDHEKDRHTLENVRVKLERERESIQALDTRLAELKVEKFESLRDRKAVHLQELCGSVANEYAAFETAYIEAQTRVENIRRLEAELAVASSKYRKFDDQLPLSRQRPAGTSWPLNGQAFANFTREFVPITKGAFLEG